MKIDVLDKGYVRLVDTLGDDLSVVNAARVSYDKESSEFSDRDERLLKFLLEHGHTSPLRHAALTFEVYMPLMVARQWWKYAVASTFVDDQNGWNESSRRYVTENEEFYVPTEWRSAPENSKQGSGDNLVRLEDKDYDFWEARDFDWNDFYDLSPEQTSNFWERELKAHITKSLHLYRSALTHGLAAEQARLFLPAYGLYVRSRWTVSLAGVLHFLSQRLEHGAQKEIQEFAVAVKDLTATAFPKTLEHYLV